MQTILQHSVESWNTFITICAANRRRRNGDYYDARAKVMETFGFDHAQAQSVTEMRVRAFCEIEKEKLSGELEEFRGKMELFQE